MPKVTLHGSINELRGKIGNLVFRKLKDGTTVVSEAPPKKDRRQKKRAKEKRSPAQKAHNESFAEAAAYGKAAQTHPVYVELAAAAPVKTAYNFAQMDWWKAPKIHRIEQVKGCIRVRATDNIMVTRVRISVLDADGRIVETGEAVRRRGSWWEFPILSQGQTLRAEAWDMPGHMTRFDLRLQAVTEDKADRSTCP